MKKLQTFEIWHTNEFGAAIHKQKGKDFEDAIIRCPAKIKQTMFEIVSIDTGDSKTRSEILEEVEG